MATAPCPPHSTVQSAITSNSGKSCRPALPVRGASRPSQQAMNRSKPSSHAIRLLRRKAESISPEPGKPSLGCQGDSRCESPGWGLSMLGRRRVGVYIVDFSGHGPTAALNTFRLHTLMHELRFLSLEPARLLLELNARLVALLPVGRFATMFY